MEEIDEIEMETRQVPREEWPRFFDGFTRRHAGWLATLRVLNRKIGAQVQVRELPLEGIEADPQSKSISIHLGSRPERHMAHPVGQPTRVWVEQEPGGGERALEIESVGGTRTILEFRSTFPADMVDGLAAPGIG